MNTKFPIRLAAALLKHAVTRALGDDALSALAGVGLDEAQNRLDEWLQEESNQKALSQAMQQADACFSEQVQDEPLRQIMHDLPLRDLPALKSALAALPASADENALEEAIREAVARDWPGLDSAQRDLAVRVYLLCLRRALLPIEKQTLLVIGRSALRMEEQLRRLETQLQAWMAREQTHIDRAVTVYGHAYQSVIISGDRNTVHYIVNNFFVGNIWELAPQRLPALPLTLREEEKAYLRLLRDETDRVTLAEDERRTHKDRSQRVALHRVYVDLATTAAPTLNDAFERLNVPERARASLRAEMATWLQRHGEDEARRLSVDEVGGYASMLMNVAGDEDDWKQHPLSQWVKDRDELEQALAPITAVEALAKQDSLVLLGDPGSGKSTFVNHLAYTLAGAMLDEEPDWQEILEHRFSAPLYPLRVVVRRWSGGLKEGVEPGVELVYQALESLFTHIERRLLLQRLEHPHTLVMFDGLDESPIAEEEGEFDRRAVILESIRQFREAHPRCRVLVTSRIRPYDDPRYRLPDFPTATLASLDGPRIGRFVRQWYAELKRIGDLDEAEAENYGRRLLNAIDRRQDLAEMAQSPLLLTMLAVVNRRAGLPESRADLYYEVVRQLLWEWERAKAEEGKTMSLIRLLEAPQPPLKTIDVERVLWELTYKAHERSGKRTADVPVDELRKALTAVYPGNKHKAWAWASRVIALMQERSGLLIPVDDDTFTFPHRSFQEYLAARWLLELDDPGEEALELVENDIWHEVILLACGYLAAKGPAALWKSIVLTLAEGMEDDFERWQAPLLAGVAWKEYGFDKVSERAAKRLRRELPPILTEIMQNPDIPPAQRLEAGLILADLGVLPDDLDKLITIDAADLGYAFRIGKYPVTNAQYQRFMDAGGYEEERWWSEQGWSYRERWGWNKPRWWKNPRFNKATQPVVGVSWYEAMAYCQWLTETWRQEGRIRENEMVRLPTEAEWKAAAGPTRYAWGDDFDPVNVNSEESGLGQTTPVHMHPTGAAPTGVHDLNGNVWEWMYNAYREGSRTKALRGGAFWNNAKRVTSAARNYWFPDHRYDLLGFRVVVVPVSRSS